MADHFQAIQERIEGILVLMKTTKRFEDRARLLHDLQGLLEEADQMLLQELTAPKAKAASAG